ncbi:MAG: hypothetical protein HY782_21615 [Chloroflexi bacterium]|nr:hypothetical protein [Chloroflexota bacterium]
MKPTWFSARFPPSRFAIEAELRSAIWKAGFGDLWLSCAREEPPYECQGAWRGKKFTIEWEPANYLLLKLPEPNRDLLEAFEHLLQHRALAGYKNANGEVIVEWRVKDAEARFQELQATGVSDLTRLNA